jgi:D-alanyl-D-alanine dipeptidase
VRFFTLLAAILGLPLNSIAEPPVPDRCQQVVCVKTAGWDSATGSLQRWERAGPQAPWKKVGGEVPVAVGEHGLAWGLGLHEIPKDDGTPHKKEGDHRAPAGVFRLTSAFGFGAEPVGKLPWRQITPAMEAIDDPASRFYNRIVDRREIEKPDWRTSEHMATIPAYALGVVVEHNPRILPGAGSCIFMHLWRGTKAGTAGCTALREADLNALVRWLDESRQPVLIQLPDAIMDRVWKVR